MMFGLVRCFEVVVMTNMRWVAGEDFWRVGCGVWGNNNFMDLKLNKKTDGIGRQIEELYHLYL